MVDIVMDTNVFISALVSRDGASREVLRRCLLKLYTPLFGEKLFHEYEEILGRKNIFNSCPLSEQERNEVFDAFLSVSRWVSIFFLWRPNLPDEGDNHVLELAISGGAKAIITHNVRDFAKGDLKFFNIQILTPSQFLKTH